MLSWPKSFDRALRARAANGLTNIITADEHWYYLSYDHSSQWSAFRDQVPAQELKQIDSKESMFTLILSGHGLLTFDNSAKGCKMNSQYFCDVVLEEAQRAVTADGENYMDDCKVHNPAKTTERLDECQVTRLPHPPYSRDFWVFGWSKNEMRGQRFQAPDDGEPSFRSYGESSVPIP
jgi:hypothetical protein